MKMRFESVLAMAFAAAPVIAQGAPLMKNTSVVPTHYGILLTPSVTPIDLFGPLDVLTGLAMYYLNATGKMKLSVLSANKTTSTTNPPLPGLDFGFALPAKISFEEYLSTGSKESPLDVLLVPGGGGTRLNVTKEIAFVKQVYPNLEHIISVCTGSTILARAGVLDDKHATTNKKAWDWATSFGTNVTYQPHARWVHDGNIWSSSGVSAGVDVTYAFVGQIYGETVAQYVADASEYIRWPNASYDPFMERWGAGKKTSETSSKTI